VELDKSKFRKEIIVPFTGQRFFIRRVAFKAFMSEIGGLPLPMALAVQDVIADLQEKAKSGDAETEAKITKFYVTRGVIEPKIWFGNEIECPADQIYYLDLGSDLDALSAEIINYSNGVAVTDMEHFFFEQTRAGAPGLNGAEVRPETVEPTS